VNALPASLLMWGVAAILVVTSLRARRRGWLRGPRVTSAMTLFALVLVAASLLRGMQAGGLQADVAEVSFDFERAPPVSSTRTGLPDIYVLLLDAYPGGTAARSAEGFDAAAFPNALISRAFDLSADSRSNYMTTRLTLPSMFGARYLTDAPQLAPGATRESDSRALRLATDAGIVLSELGAKGYQRIAVASGFSELGPIRVDRLVVLPQLTEMEAAIFISTGAGGVVDFVAPQHLANEVRTRVLDTFQAAAAIAEESHDTPRFVFIQVPAPHAPWVADAHGNLTTASSSILARPDQLADDVAERRRRFYDYATWVGDLTISTIDRILDASVTRPVIAVFSDHGPDFDFNNDDPLASDLNIRTSILMAVLTPDRADVLPDRASVVNLFPHVLNRYVGSNLAIQPDRFWAWRANSSILDFVEIDPRTWKAK
jgi:hypothetical protein